MSAKPLPERNVGVDGLRTASTALLVFYHAAQTYDHGDAYHLKAPIPDRSSCLSYFTLFVKVWHMPLFFLLAGWSLQGSLLARGLYGALSERSRKLLLPLAFGMIAFGPYLRWTEMRHGLMKTLQGELILPNDLPYTQVQYTYFTEPGMITWSHLWFLSYLWTFSVVYSLLWTILSPVLTALVSDKPSRTYIVLILSLVAITASEVYLRERWPGYQNLVDDWANFTSYSVIFVLGLIIGSQPMMQLICCKQSFTLLLLGTMAAVWHAAFCLTDSDTMFCHLSRAGGSWASSLGYLAICLKRGSLTSRTLSSIPKTFQKAAFPVYIVHQVILVALAEFLILRHSLPVPIQLPLLTILGFVLSWLAFIVIMAAPLLPQIIFGEPFMQKKSQQSIGKKG